MGSIVHFNTQRCIEEGLKVLWFVKYGPDASHMWEAKHFERLKDARVFAAKLPLTPTGGTRPYMIEKYEYTKCNVYGDIVKITEVQS